jgi:hypothetical protein
MIHRIIFGATLFTLTVGATIIDRTAVIVGKRVVKDSDIDRDIRVTSFLNGQRPDFSPSSRKQTAGRLIDQELIRDQIRSGRYPVAAQNEVDALLAQTRKARFATDAQYQRALTLLGINEDQVKERLAWQLTVLLFIDARFQPAVVVSDQEIQQYYDAHQAELRRAHPEAKVVDDLKSEIQQLIAGKRVNQLLEEWLAQSRKETRIDYLEKALQ